MKAKILSTAVAWLLIITLLHVQLNVGWARLADKARVWMGGDRQELIVGFLPVT